MDIIVEDWMKRTGLTENQYYNSFMEDLIELSGCKSARKEFFQFFKENMPRMINEAYDTCCLDEYVKAELIIGSTKIIFAVEDCAYLLAISIYSEHDTPHYYRNFRITQHAHPLQCAEELSRLVYIDLNKRRSTEYNLPF